MFDRYEAGEQAVLVHVNFSDEGEREDLDELKMLCISFAAPDFAHFSGPSGYAKFLAKAYVGRVSAA